MALFDHVLITGGNGMLAHAFRDLLSQRGISYVAPPRAELDVTSPADIVLALDRARPTLVLNCSAYTKVDLAEIERERRQRRQRQGRRGTGARVPGARAAAGLTSRRITSSTAA